MCVCVPVCRMGKDGSQLRICLRDLLPTETPIQPSIHISHCFTGTKRPMQGSAVPGFSMKIRKDILKKAGRKLHPPPTASNAEGKKRCCLPAREPACPRACLPAGQTQRELRPDFRLYTVYRACHAATKCQVGCESFVPWQYMQTRSLTSLAK